MLTRRHLAVVVAALALVLAMPGAGPAMAAAGPPAAFATQARHAGLNAAQARQLQAEVNGYLARLGGTQVSANEIRLGPGARLVVVVPGERTARHLGARLEPSGCPYLYLCAYPQPNFAGSPIEITECGSPNGRAMPWWGYGSWRNNQTAGTRPVFWFYDGSTAWVPGAYSSMSSYNWGPVTWLQAC